MKKLCFALFTLLFVVVACSKGQDDAEPVVAQTDNDAVVETVVAEVEAPVAEDDEEIVNDVAATSESEGDDDGEASDEIVLAVADPTPVPAVESKFKEGQHYKRLSPVQPVTGSPEKIEVAEVFMFSCPHCYNFEPHIVAWLEEKAPYIEFVRIPAMFNPMAETHARAYYAAVQLGISDEIMTPFFRELHINRKPLNTEASLIEFFGQFDISEEDFLSAYNSFEVDRMSRDAKKLAIRYQINSVPTIIINGKYTTGADLTGGYEKLLELINELAAQEATQR